MMVAGVVLLLAGAAGSLWMQLKNLSELAMLFALVAGLGAGLCWGWMAGVGSALAGVGALQVATWRKYRR